MAGFMRQRRIDVVTFASSVMMIMMMMTILQITSVKSLPIVCTAYPVVLRQTWRHPCRGSSELSIAASDEVAEAVTPMPVESIRQQLRLLKEGSASVKNRAMTLKNS